MESLPQGQALTKIMKEMENNVPLGRLGDPDEIAKTISFRASDEAGYMAGTELYGDGGVAQIYALSALLARNRKGETMASLQSRLDEFKHVFESGAPPYNAPREAIETMHRATAELKASGIESRTLKVGDHAPKFTLFNQNHFEVSSADLLRQGPLVVSFFRGHW